MRTNTEPKPSALQLLADNLINGNLSTAKKQARRHSAHTLRRFFADECQWSGEKSALAAIYLKDPSNESFQAYCDAV
jgi:hypothetical protein